MKKILLQFAALLLVICGIFLLAGRSDGWVEPVEEINNDIILSGTKYSGKVVIKITLHPDGTGEHEGNGDVVPATWEQNSDGTMSAHFNVKGTDYDMIIRDDGTQYVADYPLVADMQLTGGKPVRDIMLSGTKYNGKVVVNITLHADGTGEHEGNGDKTPATWEAGTGDIAMVVHFNVKGTDYDMNVVDNGTQYVADYPLVADMQLTGAKSGAAVAPAETTKEAPAEPAAEAPAEPAKESEKQETAEAAAPAEEAKSEEAPSYPTNAFVLPFTADINEQLKTTFYVEFDMWSKALGTSGSYAPAESKDLLFSWTGSGKSNELDFFADGTYEFRFTKMSITEHGTWRFENGKLALTSEAGKEQPAELNRAAAAPAKTQSEEAAVPANTYTLEYVADINKQLTGSFSCPPDRWQAALGDSDSYAPTESEELLISWDATGKSKKMDFFANGTYEFQFTTMSISEKGTWTYADGKLFVTTAAGKEYVAELTQ